MKALNFAILFLLSAILLAGCSRNADSAAANNQTPASAGSAAPYNDKEPEKYQVEVLQTTPGGTVKYFLARDGNKWRMDANLGQPYQVTTIHTDKEFVAAHATKTYAEYALVHGYDDRPDMVGEMTRRMLNNEAMGTYEKIGTENGVTKYKYTSDKEPGLESIVSFDEKLGLPVKKEIFQVEGTQRTPIMTVSFENYKTDVDPALFEVPKDFKKVGFEEMKKTLVESPGQ